MHIIRMPSLAENVEVATLSAWRVETGSAVTAGSGVADVVTEKAAFTLETEASGVVTHLLTQPGSVVPPGYALLLLDATTEQAQAVQADNEERLARLAGMVTGDALDGDTISGTIQRRGLTPGEAIRATPAARRAARAAGVDLADIARGLPPGAMVREEDVAAYGKRS